MKRELFGALSIVALLVACGSSTTTNSGGSTVSAGPAAGAGSGANSGAGSGATGSGGTGTLGNGNGTGSGGTPVGPASSTFTATTGFASAGEDVLTVPANTQFSSKMMVLEGDKTLMVDVLITKLKGGESEYRIQYTTPQGMIEDLSVSQIAARDYFGESATRLDVRGLPIQTLMQRRSNKDNTAVRLFSLRESGRLEKVFLFGLPTDPVDVQAREAMATYTGDLFLGYSSDPSLGVEGTSSGAATVTADFDAASLSGTATMVTSSANTADGDFLKDATVGLSGTIGTGNDFAATLALTTPAAGSTLTGLDAAIDGAFFGQGATSLGGEVDGTVTTSAHGTLPLIGGLVAKE